MESWSSEVVTQIDKKLENEKEKEIRFYRIDEFKRNIKRVDLFSNSCPVCQQQKIPIKAISEKIDEAIKVPGKTRREYDELISQLSKHIQKEHGFYAPYYFSYTYSFIGIALGLGLGFILLKLFPTYQIEMISIGFVTGLLPSYIWGSVKDKKIRKEKRLM